MNKPAVTQAQIKRAFAVAADLSLPVAGIRCNPDGSTDVLFGQRLTDPAPPPSAVEDDGGWGAHEKRHGHG